MTKPEPKIRAPSSTNGTVACDASRGPVAQWPCGGRDQPESVALGRWGVGQFVPIRVRSCQSARELQGPRQTGCERARVAVLRTCGCGPRAARGDKTAL